MQRSVQPCDVSVNSYWLTLSAVCHYSLICSSVTDLSVEPHGGFPDDINTDYNSDVIKPASSSLCHYGDI